MKTKVEKIGLVLQITPGVDIWRITLKEFYEIYFIHFVGLGSCLLGLGHVCWADSDLVVRQNVIKMGTCIGIGDIIGFEFRFTDEQSWKTDKNGVRIVGSDSVAEITLPPQQSPMVPLIVTQDESSYVPGMDANGNYKDYANLAYSPWKVKDQKILLWIQGQWVSVVIDSNKKTCSISLILTS